MKTLVLRVLPYLAVAAGGVVLVACVFLYGVKTGGDRVWARVAEQRQDLYDVERRAREAAAVAISQIEVRHVTINQRAEKEVIREERYRECAHSPAVYGLLNDALADRDPGPVVGAGGMPGADSASGPVVRGNDSQAARSNSPVP